MWESGERIEASRTLASLCVAKIYCRIQFPVFIAHFQQHLLSLPPSPSPARASSMGKQFLLHFAGNEQNER